MSKVQVHKSCSQNTFFSVFLKSTIVSDIYEHVLYHSKEKKTNKQTNYQTAKLQQMERNKTVYCEGYTIDLCVYIVDNQLERAKNLLITYTHLFIYSSSSLLPQANEIQLHLYCGLWENRHICIFNSFIMFRGISTLVVTDTILLLF